MPWQQHVADVGLELNPDGSLVYPEVNLVVGRQEGKTELKFIIAVLRLTAMTVTHGPQRVTYTMQDRKRARTRLERDYAPRLRSAAGFREIPSSSRRRPTRRNEWRLGMNAGVEHIQFGKDSWLQIDTPSRTGGHGDTLDLGLIDEAFAHQDDTVEVGMEPAMLTRADAQLWVLSAAGDKRSYYLWRKVRRGRKAVEQGADSGFAYFEWSAEDDADPSNPATWNRACPALGRTVTEAKLAALWRKAVAGKESGEEGAIDAFCRSYLCMWPEVPVLEEDAGSEWAIDKASWQAAEVADAKEPAQPFGWAIDVSADRRNAAFAMCGVAEDGRKHVEVVDHRPGTGWVVERAKGLKDRRGARFAIAASSPAASLIPDLEKAGVEIIEIPVAEHAGACGALHDGVLEQKVVHIGQGPLTSALAGAAKRSFSGDSWLWSRKASTVDICPLVAVTLAAHAQGITPADEEKPVFAY